MVLCIVWFMKICTGFQLMQIYKGLQNCELDLPAKFGLCKFVQDFQLRTFGGLNLPAHFSLRKYLRNFKLRTKFTGLF